MLQNAYSLAKIGADTAENERNFDEILPKIGKILANFCLADAPGRLGGEDPGDGHGPPCLGGNRRRRSGKLAAGLGLSWI